MPLASGSRLGSHEIIRLIGAGGMGEVYLALDTKLNRRVAIKVLPDSYAQDPERIARFHREATAVAALNHAGIAAIYELAEATLGQVGQVGQAEVVRFLVLELVEGDTLADRVGRGPMPVEEALVVAKQILEALEAAHEKGICHRDLKPANVKLTVDGTVKVLDFGLAKFLQTGPSAANLTHSPTISLAATYPGVILGTAGYMSPEQAKGFEADQRSDIFSFGCVLYELLTGRRAFEGETVSEVLAGVLKSDVDFSALPQRLNPRLVEVLRRCLEKNPKKRWHAAGDVRVEIEALMGHGLVVAEPRTVEVRRRPLWRRVGVPAVQALVVGLAAGYGAWRLKPEPPRTVTRFSIPLPEGQQFTNVGRQVIAFSPDGANLVYVANQRLYLRALSGLSERVITGTYGPAGVSHPVFSPDGKTVAYYSSSDRTLKRIDISGGAALTICSTDVGTYGISWSEQGIVFGSTKGIFRVSPGGGTPELIEPAGPDEILASPQMLPDGQALLFSVGKGADSWDKGRIVVRPLPGRERKTVIDGGADGRYLPTGHLVYALSGVLLVVPFDLGRLTASGSAVPIVEGVRRTNLQPADGPPTAQFSYSSTGSLAYLPGPVTAKQDAADLAIFDRKGVAQPLKLPLGGNSAPRVSGDGKRIAFERADPREASVWTYELIGERSPQRLTFGGNNRAPIWSPDGQWIAFQSDREGDPGDLPSAC